MKAIVTVVGKDAVGIIAYVCTILAERGVNVLDISQTVLKGYFTMMMIVELGAGADFAELADELGTKGEARALSIRIQREDIFESMHRI